jgi:hypothetical protein
VTLDLWAMRELGGGTRCGTDIIIPSVCAQNSKKQKKKTDVLVDFRIVLHHFVRLCAINIVEQFIDPSIVHRVVYQPRPCYIDERSYLNRAPSKLCFMVFCIAVRSSMTPSFPIFFAIFFFDTIVGEVDFLFRVP